MLREKRCHFTDNIFKCIFLNENVWIVIKISLKIVPEGPINNIPELDQIMASLRPCNRPLSESKMVRLLTNICVTRPQWVISLTYTLSIGHQGEMLHFQGPIQKKHFRNRAPCLWHFHVQKWFYKSHKYILANLITIKKKTQDNVANDFCKGFTYKVRHVINFLSIAKILQGIFQDRNENLGVTSI